MTCRMAAGQQKKRLTNSNLPEQYKSKKKSKFDSLDCLVNLKSHIDLKWDESQKRVVPKMEQIGISWLDLAPSMESTCKHRSGLADVTYVPRETFSLENLREVLSYEVWATCLTEVERKFLTQFLPSGSDAEEKVHLLLTGKNHHFGNPFLSWSTSLCHGYLHPDAVLNKEHQIRADEKAYRVDLNNYHSNMIEILKKWRERWLNCDDPENLFRDNAAMQNQGDVLSPEENTIFTKDPKKEAPQEVVQNGDASKFMSYIKISRRQHDLVKNMKHSGDGIQTEHLTRVIGNLDNFLVEPYQTFIEDEQKRLHEHWLNISCKDLPAACEVRRDRDMLIEKLRKLLGDELAEKNISAIKKAEQSADTPEDQGQLGAYETDDIPDAHEELLKHSLQGALQGGNDHSPSGPDKDVKDTNYTDTCIHRHDSLNVKDQDLMDINDTNITSQSQNSPNVQDHHLKDISCTDTTIHCVNSPGKLHEDLQNMSSSHSSPDVQEDSKDINYADTTIDNHNSPEIQAQVLKAVSYTNTPIHSYNNQNMQVEDIEDVSYTGPSVCAHGITDEQDQDLKSINYAGMNNTGHNVNNFPSANSHPEMNPVIVYQEESENIAIIPSNSSSLLAEPSGEQIHGEGVLELKDPTACGKDIWQTPGPLDSYYHPQENSMYTESGDLQLKHSHLPGGHLASVIELENDIISQQQAQVTIASAFQMDNTAPLMQPSSSRQNNVQLQTLPKDMGMVPSYSLERMNDIKQSSDLHSMGNNPLAQSSLFHDPLQEQKQMVDQRHTGLYVQQLQNNLYSGVSFPTQRNFPVIEQQPFVGRAPTDRNFSWFPEEHQSHNNWSGMESDNNSLAQSLPGGSSTDGSLYSVLSQYKQASAGMQFGRPSSSQFRGMANLGHPAQNLVPRTQNTAPLTPNIYGYAQNLPSNPSSHVASVNSLNNMQWTNFIQQNPGMPDPMNRQFRGPWTR